MDNLPKNLNLIKPNVRLIKSNGRSVYLYGWDANNLELYLQNPFITNDIDIIATGNQKEIFWHYYTKKPVEIRKWKLIMLSDAFYEDQKSTVYIKGMTLTNIVANKLEKEEDMKEKETWIKKKDVVDILNFLPEEFVLEKYYPETEKFLIATKKGGVHLNKETIKQYAVKKEK